jgi:hypothetical protein
MDFNSRDILLFIEETRIKQKYNQITFCDGIISVRNYRRYLNEDAQVKFEVVLQFIHRLGYSYSAFFEALIQYKDSLSQRFKSLDKSFKDFNYDQAKSDIQEIKTFSLYLTTSQVDQLRLYEKLIHLYDHLEHFNDPKDQQTALQILEQTELLTLLKRSVYTYDEFMFINVLMNKIYNLLPLHIQRIFQQFYQAFIDGEKSIIDGDALEHIQQIYSYYVSSIYGKGYITKSETIQGGILIKDGIKLTRLTHMIYNLMALNYLNSSMCYLHKEIEAAKKSAYMTFITIFAQDNSAGLIPAFKTAFGQVIPIETLKIHLLEELDRYFNQNINYYKEVNSYHDLSTFHNEDH